jgi:hypothetical protein
VLVRFGRYFSQMEHGLAKVVAVSIRAADSPSTLKATSFTAAIACVSLTALTALALVSTARSQWAGKDRSTMAVQSANNNTLTSGSGHDHLTPVL